MPKHIKVPLTTENHINPTASLTDLESLGVKTTTVPEVSDEDIAKEFADDLWLTVGKRSWLNEDVLSRWFIKANNVKYCNGVFYTSKGQTPEGQIIQDLTESVVAIDGYGHNQTSALVHRILDTMKGMAYTQTMPRDNNLIPFANGNFYLNTKEFRIGEITPTPYRLTVALRQNKQKTPYFDKWLYDLFEPEDIPVLQQFMGYCLVPTTRSQKALFLVGEAGMGKSGIGKILEAMLGSAIMSVGNTKEFLNDKFKLPELDQKLVLYDDDLSADALNDTGLYKKLITNDMKITADRKYSQPFTFVPFARLVTCANEMLKSTNDMTEGFYRRLLPIVVRSHKARKTDLNFYEKLTKEKEGILLWMLKGLFDLKANNWELTPSKRTEQYLNSKRELENPLPLFIETVFDFDPNGVITSTDFYDVYKTWCFDNAVEKLSAKQVATWLSDNAEKYGIQKSNHIVRNGRQLRGYKGVAIKEQWQKDNGKIHLAI